MSGAHKTHYPAGRRLWTTWQRAMNSWDRLFISYWIKMIENLFVQLYSIPCVEYCGIFLIF